MVFLHLLNGGDEFGHIPDLRTANLIVVIFSHRNNWLVRSHDLIVLSRSLLPCFTLNPRGN